MMNKIIFALSFIVLASACSSSEGYGYQLTAHVSIDMNESFPSMGTCLCGPPTENDKNEIKEAYGRNTYRRLSDLNPSVIEVQMYPKANYTVTNMGGCVKINELIENLNKYY